MRGTAVVRRKHLVHVSGQELGDSQVENELELHALGHAHGGGPFPAHQRTVHLFRGHNHDLDAPPGEDNALDRPWSLVEGAVLEEGHCVLNEQSEKATNKCEDALPAEGTPSPEPIILVKLAIALEKLLLQCGVLESGRDSPSVILFVAQRRGAALKEVCRIVSPTYSTNDEASS